MPLFSGKPQPWEPVIRSMQLPPPPKRPEVGGLTVFFGGKKRWMREGMFWGCAITILLLFKGGTLQYNRKPIIPSNTGGYFLWQPQTVGEANIYHVERPWRKNADFFQVVPQVTAAEAAGQVLSNSVERWWLRGWGYMLGVGFKKITSFGENDGIFRCCWKYVNQLIQEHAVFWGVRGCKMQAPKSD